MAANRSRSAGGRDALAEYRNKRTPGQTPEPFGSVARGDGARSFVVQKHAARRTHYDFRLELEGVLVSWAVPRGPSLDPKEKRLAVQVENHPLDYGGFEGVIPEGNYGAGSVIVWDRGIWEPIGDPSAGLAAGEIKFRLHGYKLGGEWVIVKTKRRQNSDGNEWLLIKKKDEFSRREPPSEASVLSGLTVEELRDPTEHERRIRDAADELGAPRRKVDARKLDIALCEPRREPFSAQGWLFELKYDGYRLIAEVRGGDPLLRYRRGSDVTQLYPELTFALSKLPFESLVIDGEVVVFDGRGCPDFNRLQQRAMLRRARDIDAAAIAHPATFVAFDLLEVDGRDLRKLPLIARKELLRRVLPDAGPLRYSDHIEDRGEEMFEQVRQLGLEGVVGKRAASPYPSGRSPDWIKVRSDREDDFAIVGYRRPDKGSRVGFRALHMAVRDGDRWLYAGRVGSGFDDRELRAIREQLDQLPRARYRFPDAEATRDDVWVAARLVCTVRYLEWREDHLVRAPSFLRLRTDKAPEECTRPKSAQIDEPPEPAAIEAEPAPERTLSLSNLDKVFWPDEGYTKGDLIAYYRDVSPWLMPYLRDRLVVLTRFPDGIGGKSFYQKDAPGWVPEWIRTRTVWSEHSQRDIHYFICDDVDSLVYLVNLGTIPLHVWSSRASDLERPDWTILDLDPKGAPFANVVALALAIRKLCDEIELPSYVKTSGSSGLHVLIPLGGQCTYEESRNLAGLIAQIIEADHGEIATTARAIDRRAGKVYIDWLQNRHGQLLVAPFSVRPLPRAPVSMPLRWSEVGRKLEPAKFTIANAVARLARLRDEPMRPVLGEKPDLLAALERLSERLGS